MFTGLKKKATIDIIQRSKPAKVVGLCGRGRSGKDTVASYLQAFGYERVAFADPLKTAASALGWDGTKEDTLSGRSFLVKFGRIIRDNYAEDFCIERAHRTIYEWEFEQVIVTDVRYQNELDWIHELGGPVVRVIRPDTPLLGCPLEADAEELQADYTFWNDETHGKLRAKVENILVPLINQFYKERAVVSSQ